MSESAVLGRSRSVRQGATAGIHPNGLENTVEGLVAVVARLIAGNTFLVGFGIDSFAEATSGSVLLWRMSVDTEERDQSGMKSGR